jgi:formate hydrogenlyase subunit 4
MFGKAIQLEVAGPGLALLEWAEALRLTFLLVMLSNLAMPRLMAVATHSLFTNLALALLCLAKLIIPVLLLAIWESMQIKARLRAIMAPVSAPLVLTFIAAMLAIVERFTWK